MFTKFYESIPIQEEGEDLKSRRRRRGFVDQCYVTFLHVVIVVFMVALAWSMNRRRDPSLGIYSPANEAVEYETVVFRRGFGTGKSPYQGYPTEAHDALWDDLYQYGVRLHIDEEQAWQLPNKTVGIPGLPDQYVIGLDVFHQLHCVNMFRKSLYPEIYNSSVFFPNGTRDDDMTTHYDHCIESLRQSMMCHSDVSTLFWTWVDDENVAKIRLETTHTCRNFEKIREWAFDKFLDNFNPYIHVPGPWD